MPAPVQKRVKETNAIQPTERLYSKALATTTIAPSLAGSVVPTKKITPTTTPISTSPTPSPTIAIAKTTVKIMPMGDSITDGVFFPGGYRTYLWSMLQQNGYNVDFVGSLANGSSDLGDWNHEGHIGWDTGTLAGASSSLVVAAQPDIILLHIGTNDLDHGSPGETITGSLSTLLANIFAAKPDTFVIVSTIVTSRGDKNAWANYNGAIPGLVSIYRGQGRRISYVDMSQGLTEADLYDGIHPNTTGYIKMAAYWYPTLTTVYSQLQSQ